MLEKKPELQLMARKSSGNWLFGIPAKVNAQANAMQWLILDGDGMTRA